MPKTKAREIYGPWIKGVNYRDSLDSLQDTELSEIVNFDVADDGALVRRPSLSFMDDLMSGRDATSQIVGAVLGDNNNDVFVYFKAPTGTQFWYVSNGDPALTTFTGLTATSGYYEVLKYNGFTYFVNQSTGLTFRVASDTTSGGAALVSNWPAGSIENPYNGRAFIFKDRAWVVNGNRLYYSKATDPTTWNSSGAGAANMFFDVGPGDGDKISAVVVQNDTLYIFKNKSVWAFRYSSDPATDGYLQVISQGKGAHYAIAYENQLYCVDEFSVYVFQNGIFTDIARSLNLIADSNFNYRSLYAWNNRLFLVASDLYAMNLRTGAWSKYTGDHNGAVGVEEPDSTSINFSFDKMVAWSDYQNTLFIGNSTDGLYKMQSPDSVVSVDRMKVQYYDTNGNFLYSTIRYVEPHRFVHSKVFTFNDEFFWKKLFAINVQKTIGVPEPSYVDMGTWFVEDYDLQIADRFDKATVFDKGRLPLQGMFRFKSLLLVWEAKAVIYDSLPNLGYLKWHPGFKKIELIVAKGAET